METTTIWIVLVVVVLLIIGGLAGMLLSRKRRTKRLEERFGPEYDQTISKVGDQVQAERELEERIARVEALNIRALGAEEVNRYALEWQKTQSEFVDEPLMALQKADHLIQEVMKAKGYPMQNFEQRAADISVDFPELVTDYRGMHRIAVKEIKDKVSTEEMRQAMVHARALFENLIKQEPNKKELNQKEKI